MVSKLFNLLRVFPSRDLWCVLDTDLLLDLESYPPWLDVDLTTLHGGIWHIPQ